MRTKTKEQKSKQIIITIDNKYSDFLKEYAEKRYLPLATAVRAILSKTLDDMIKGGCNEKCDI